MEELGVVIIGYLVVMLLTFGFSIALYVLQALGMYRIASRRGIPNPWLAWIPVANMWTLGSISDQFQYVAKGKVKNRRKVLLGLQIAMAVCGILIIVLAILLMASVVQSELTEMSVNMDMGLNVEISNADIGMDGLGAGLGVLAVYLAMMTLAIVMTVFAYIACYDLFASCHPDNAAVFLVLSIFFNVTLPFFIFAVRNKDLGMPPRRQEPAVPVAEPVPEPVADTIVEPMGSGDVVAEPEDFEE